jgi:hypothetical protein
MKKQTQVRTNGGHRDPVSQAKSTGVRAPLKPATDQLESDHVASGTLQFYDSDSAERFGEFQMHGDELESLFDSAAAARLTAGQFIQEALRDKIARCSTRRASRFVTAVLPNYTAYNRLVALALLLGADMSRLAGAAVSKALDDRRLRGMLHEGLCLSCHGSELVQGRRAA